MIMGKIVCNVKNNYNFNYRKQTSIATNKALLGVAVISVKQSLEQSVISHFLLNLFAKSFVAAKF